MTSIFPDFRHSVDDEPTEDWTVEELMQWCLLRSHEATDSKHEELVQLLDQQLTAGTQEIWDCHETAVGTENENPHDELRKRNAAASATKINNDDVMYIHITITEGPNEHVGQTFKLQPKPRAPCWVGRSTGKKYRERGISLAKDDEVSTTHGKFELKGGKAFFTDTGSTNGTVHNGVELEDNVPLELNDGTLLKLGCTMLKVTLLRAGVI